MSFKTINNTTPFFEGTDTHALVGHSSYSTTGTTSHATLILFYRSYTSTI